MLVTKTTRMLTEPMRISVSVHMQCAQHQLWRSNRNMVYALQSDLRRGPLMQEASQQKTSTSVLPALPEKTAVGTTRISCIRSPPGHANTNICVGHFARPRQPQTCSTGLTNASLISIRCVIAAHSKPKVGPSQLLRSILVHGIPKLLHKGQLNAIPQNRGQKGVGSAWIARNSPASSSKVSQHWPVDSPRHQAQQEHRQRYRKAEADIAQKWIRSQVLRMASGKILCLQQRQDIASSPSTELVFPKPSDTLPPSH